MTVILESHNAAFDRIREEILWMLGDMSKDGVCLECGQPEEPDGTKAHDDGCGYKPWEDLLDAVGWPEKDREPPEVTSIRAINATQAQRTRPGFVGRRGILGDA